MKIGLIADIHADFRALQAVLTRLKDVHQVDKILCAGDIAGRGHDEDAVVKLMRSLQTEIPTVKGNHDSPTIQTGDENAAYLRQLPLHYHTIFEDVRLFMCHGRPGIPFIGYLADRVHDEELSDLLETQEADVAIVGHTHTPMFKTVPEGCVINPGALCAPYHHYGVLYLPEIRFALYSLNDSPKHTQQCFTM